MHWHIAQYSYLQLTLSNVSSTRELIRWAFGQLELDLIWMALLVIEFLPVEDGIHPCICA